MDIDTPTPPPAPAPVDPGQSALDYINAMSDPALQQRLLQVEQQYRPQYANLNLADLQTYLQGTPQQTGALALFGDASQFAAQTQADANRLQREADIRDVQELGPQATQAFRQANPELQAALNRAGGMASSSDFFSGLRQQIAQQPNFGDITFNPVSGQSVGTGLLGQNLYDQAVSQPNLGQVGGLLQGRAAELAQSTGRLNPDEIRSAQQAVREAYAARGTEMGSGAVSAEALSRLAGERGRMVEDLGLAAALNAQNLGEIGQNRAFQQSVQGADISRQTNNAQMANQIAMLNAQLGLGAQESNRAFQAGQYQQGIQNMGLLGQLDQSRLAQDRAYALQLAQAQAATASDPFMSILGRQSGALQYGAGQQGFAGGLTQSMQGPQLFNPDAGINLALQNAANQGNYQASTYGAQAAASGQRTGGIFGAAGGILGGLFGNPALFS